MSFRFGRPLLVVLLMVGVPLSLSCGGQSSGSGARVSAKAPLRILALTDLLGTLEPCGCTSAPLGGASRLLPLVDQLRSEAPTLFVHSGGLLFSEHHGEEGAERQECWKAETWVGLLGDARLAATTLAPSDALFGPEARDRVLAGARFPVLGREGSGRRPWVVKQVGGLRVGLFEAGPELDEAALQVAGGSVAELVAAGTAIRIALTLGGQRVARRIARLPGVDFVVAGGVHSRDVLPPENVGDATLLHAGAEGQHLLAVDVFPGETGGPFRDASEWTRDLARERVEGRIGRLRAQLERWETSGNHAEADLAVQRKRLGDLRQQRQALQAAPSAEGKRFVARLVPIAQSMNATDAIADVMRAYDQRVNRHNAESFAGRVPEPAAPGASHYVGSAACQSCHREAFSWWQGHHHGRAYATLEVRHKEFNLSCVGCHVTGYEQPGGATVTHLRDGTLKDVGCESCHGAGSRHVEQPETPGLVEREVPERVCVSCHNPEHSDRFVYEAFRRSLLVPGHGLLDAANGGR